MHYIDNAVSRSDFVQKTFSSLLFSQLNPDLNHGRREVAFIDTQVTDWQVLARNIPTGIEVILLDATQDGLAQIAAWAKSHTGYDALHILSHGNRGTLYLGTTLLNDSTFVQYQPILSEIGNAITEDGDVLLYGCHVAQNNVGRDFVGKLAQTIGVDIAASNDLAANLSSGGNWTLEYETGTIEAKSLFNTDLLSFSSSLNGNIPPSLDLNGAAAGTAYTTNLTDAATNLVASTSLISDTENDSANWNGGSLTIQRVKAAVADGSVYDVFNFTASGLFTVTGGPITQGNDSNGTLSITLGGAQFATDRKSVV